MKNMKGRGKLRIEHMEAILHLRLESDIMVHEDRVALRGPAGPTGRWGDMDSMSWMRDLKEGVAYLPD